MKILSIECSAVPCSVAITEDDKILASSYSNVKLTHSQTLMPMIENILKTSDITLNEIDAFAVSQGPGSFTGIRIGISAIKGLAAADKKTCVGVSTLESIAENLSDTECIACAVMDARCNQFYNAIFDITKGTLNRLCDDRAIIADELKAEIFKISETNNKKIIIIGDGAELFYKLFENNDNIKIEDQKRRFQNAISVGIIANNKIKSGETLKPDELLPVYLRLPQAERELKLKKEKEQ